MLLNSKTKHYKSNKCTFRFDQNLKYKMFKQSSITLVSSTTKSKLLTVSYFLYDIFDLSFQCLSSYFFFFLFPYYKEKQ
jgi:hypothetical protein